ncbi:hypothetical protein SDC9_195660 [bioreactor metagenome]|uniref:Uncharacterized protein n=1 Tax=bioreactor metagenome TaxID=1076179 RepID=A0A645IAW0_9ZZZZ
MVQKLTVGILILIKERLGILDLKQILQFQVQAFLQYKEMKLMEPKITTQEMGILTLMGMVI